eukprot:3179787-Pyramimonas_sp.AAC.1
MLRSAKQRKQLQIIAKRCPAMPNNAKQCKEMPSNAGQDKAVSAKPCRSGSVPPRGVAPGPLSLANARRRLLARLPAAPLPEG